MKQNTIIGVVAVAALVGVVLLVNKDTDETGMEPSPSPSPSASVSAAPTASPTPTASTRPVSSRTPTPTPTPTPTATPTPTPTGPGTLGFSAAAYSVDEDDGTVTITVTRTGGTTGEVSVTYDTSDGTARSSDYTHVSGMLTFGAGVSSRTFTMSISDDSEAESAETVLLSLKSPQGGATLGLSSAVLTIADDESSE